MHQAEGFVQGIYYGFDLENLYFRIDPFFRTEITWKGSSSSFKFWPPRKVRSFSPFIFPTEKTGTFFGFSRGSSHGLLRERFFPRFAGDHIIELAIPFREISSRPKEKIDFFLRVQKGRSGDRTVSAQRISLPDRSGSRIMNRPCGRFEVPREKGMKTINLLFAVHNHQPVGNFDRVFREGWEKCYEPFLEALEKHPRFRISLHYSGSLLEWLETNQPDFISRLQALVAPRPGGAPERGFLRASPAFHPRKRRHRPGSPPQSVPPEKNSLFQPKGLWLAERVWSDHPSQDSFRNRVELHAGR